MLTVYVDFKVANAYLAVEPTIAMANELDVAVRWRPFRSSDRPAPTQVEDDSVAASHRRARAQSRRNMAEHYAQLRGLTLNWPEAPRSTDLALGVLGSLEDQALPFLRAAFAAYWNDGADLNDSHTVGKLLAACGVSVPLDPEAQAEQLETSQVEAEAAGVVDVPAYVFDGHVFVGREHLPWIRELVAKG